MKAREFRWIGGLLLIAGAVSIAHDLFVIFSRDLALASPSFTSIRDAWVALYPASMGASSNAVHAAKGVPAVLALVELLISIPIALALFFAGGAAIILTMRKSIFARLSPSGSKKDLSEDPVQPAGNRANVAPLALARPRVNPAHREFLPAALEIIETPPSPVAVALLWFFCLGFSTLLAWSYFGQIDIYATASGKIQPNGGSKVVQPLSPGRVVAIHVENGSHVTAGDILVELDPTEASADRKAQALKLQAVRAEIARRETAITIASSNVLSVTPIRFDQDASDVVRSREENVLAADIAHLVSSRDSLTAQLAESVARHDRMQMTVSARNSLISVLKERVDVRNTIDAQGGGYRAKVLDALQEYEREKTNLASDKGQLIEIDASKNSVKAKIDEAVAQFIDEQTSKLAEAERKRDGLVQDLIKATMTETQTRLMAPISGTVQQLSVTTVGQVVASGQSVMTIVPDNAPIEIEAMIVNRDIGFVKVGQPVTIKVDAYPFTRYGTLDGIVATISHDGVDQKTAANLSDAASLTRPQGAPTSANAATAETLAFPARIALSRETIDVDGNRVHLRPGMSVTVEIKTGQRRAIDYVLSPLREIRSASLQER